MRPLAGLSFGGTSPPPVKVAWMGILRARACEPAAISAPQATSAQGYYNAPRLAGQRVDYLVNQLQAFATHKRDEFLSTKYMWNAAAHLDPLILRIWPQILGVPPEAAMDGDSELAAEGKIIFENGVPDENIAACQACHGPEAQGVREIPRSAGFPTAISSVGSNSGARAKTGIPMPKVGRSLSPNQIAALASYLSFVRGESSEK